MASPSFASLIRDHRLAAGLTQELLAERSGVGKRTLQDLELGATRPRRETVRRLIDALALTPEARRQLEAVASAPRRGRFPTSAADPSGSARGAPDSPSGAKPRGSSAFSRQGLIPTSLTSFIGRERELIRLQQLLAGRRLLTLTGPGGSGKTRLALELVARVQPAYPDGIYVVSLAPLADPGQVGSTIAAALGLLEVPGEPPVETLARFIRERSVFLLLDNFEHLVPAGPLLVDLLTACPMLTIVVTSREVLRLRGEQTFSVPALSLPANDPRSKNKDALSVASNSEAVRLFVDRAQSVQPSFCLDWSNVEAVADICVRLDGLPLAVELAAARIRYLNPEHLWARLDHRLPLLTGGGYDMPVRQRSLRDAIAWSYDLLEPDEQALFRRLGVFAGGFTLESAEAVCDGGGSGEGRGVSEEASPHAPRHSILDLVGALVDKSLVLQIVAADAEPRYTMLETIREFAVGMLRATSEEEAFRRRHRDWCLALVAESDRHQKDAAQGQWLDRLAAEHNNLRAGLSWCIARGDVSEGLHLGASLWWFWYTRGHVVEGRAWYQRLFALDQRKDQSRVRALAHFGAGQLAMEQIDYDEASRLGQESLAIGQQLRDLESLGLAHQLLGTIARNRGDYPTARTQLQASLAVRQELGRPDQISLALGSLGSIAVGEGNWLQARLWCEQSVTLARKCGDVLQVAKVASWLGEIALETMDLSEARRHYSESLTIAHQLGNQRLLAYALEGFAAVAAGDGGFERCLILAGAAETMREIIGIPHQRNEELRWASRFDPARRALGEPLSATLVRDGRQMSTGEAIALALLGDRKVPLANDAAAHAVARGRDRR